LGCRVVARGKSRLERGSCAPFRPPRVSIGAITELRAGPHVGGDAFDGVGLAADRSRELERRGACDGRIGDCLEGIESGRRAD
jgi:hypothetical protein